MKTTDLITLQKSITQGEWRAVVVKTHVELGQFAPPAHYQIHGDIRGIGATLVSRLEPYGKDNNANAQAIALVPSLIAEVIRLRTSLDHMVKTFNVSETPDDSVCPS